MQRAADIVARAHGIVADRDRRRSEIVLSVIRDDDRTSTDGVAQRS